jgi:hypothetical protein|tara:strand:- start:17397 stop:17651 length:255 start_codon:yes stop_codon:yes gene_type:complete
MKLKNLASNMVQTSFDSGLEILFSYDTPVAAKFRGAAFKTSKKWSSTTTRHVNKWLAGKDASLLPQSAFDRDLSVRLPAVFLKP